MSEKRVESDALENVSFEMALAELESVVEELEEGALSLEESIALYERGQALARLCQDRLDRAELRVEQIQEADESGQEAGGLLC
jgi:exodeoxyribonuclease VII small subunit